MIIQKKIDQNIADLISQGGIGVLATDTIYGLVVSVWKKESIERAYKIRKRDERKPMIVLISSWEDLDRFGAVISEKEKEELSKWWPGKISIILPCQKAGTEHLRRGKSSLAFRWPKKKDLERLIRKTGPLLAPSANTSGMSPAKNIEEALKYFGNKADFYIDEGEIDSEPSTLVDFHLGHMRVIRPGAVKV
ncbi:MAG: hypothetical protein ACD_15C00024G0005 [uncultured bacterium]|nr:MAG: hypothetical protein ACD_15C00024G0005 [uncultured bacterium]